MIQQFKQWVILAAVTVSFCRALPADDLVEVDIPVCLNDRCAVNVDDLIKSVSMTLTLYRETNTVGNVALPLVLLKDGVVASNVTFTSPSYGRRDLVSCLVVRVPDAKNYQWASCSFRLDKPLFLKGRRSGYIAFVAENECFGRLSGDTRRRIMWTNGIEVVTGEDSTSYTLDRREIRKRRSFLDSSTIVDQRQYEVDWKAFRNVYALVTRKTVDTMGTNRAAVMSGCLGALTVHSNDAFSVRFLDTNVLLVASTTRALQGVEMMCDDSGEAIIQRIRNSGKIRFFEKGGQSLYQHFESNTCLTNEWVFSSPLERAIDQANTLSVRNWSGDDLSDVVVMKDSLQLEFTDLKQSSARYQVLEADKKMDVKFDATVNFRDGVAVQTNFVVTLEPVPQREVSVNILSNRIVEINVTEKRCEWSPRRGREGQAF